MLGQGQHILRGPLCVLDSVPCLIYTPSPHPHWVFPPGGRQDCLKSGIPFEEGGPILLNPVIIPSIRIGQQLGVGWGQSLSPWGLDRAEDFQRGREGEGQGG